MAELHKAWVLAAVAAGLARFEDAKVKINDVPNLGDKHEEPFKAVVFTFSTKEEVSELYTLADADKGTSKVMVAGGELETPNENPLAVLVGYAYGLNCRAKVRTRYEAKYEDPDKAVKKMAELLVKSGQFKSFEKAVAAAKLMREEPDDTE